MVELDPFANLSLRGGFLLEGVRVAVVPMTDAVGRPALARTEIVGHRLNIELAAGLPAAEISVSLYHEVLEAAAVATSHPPAAVMELNEAGFEAAARRMHADLGTATPVTLNRMLELFDF